MINTKVRIALTGGEGGIRTLEARLNPLNRLAGGPFRPLKHLSIARLANNIITDYIKKSLIIERITGTPGGIRTPNLRIRSPRLYPVELQAHALYSRIFKGFYHLKNLFLNQIFASRLSDSSTSIKL